MGSSASKGKKKAKFSLKFEPRLHLQVVSSRLHEYLSLFGSGCVESASSQILKASLLFLIHLVSLEDFKVLKREKNHILTVEKTTNFPPQKRQQGHQPSGGDRDRGGLRTDLA